MIGIYNAIFVFEYLITFLELYEGNIKCVKNKIYPTQSARYKTFIVFDSFCEIFLYFDNSCISMIHSAVDTY